MNSALKASIRALPERTIYAITASVALAGTTIAIGVVAIAHVQLGAVVSYALLPLGVALVVWVVVAVARLRVVGHLPREAEGLIPTRLQPWIRSWLLIRFGLLGSVLLLSLGAVAMAVVHGPLTSVVQAFVCVVWFRIFLDLILGAAFNAGVIYSRR
jgi:hypothetical protein